MCAVVDNSGRETISDGCGKPAVVSAFYHLWGCKAWIQSLDEVRKFNLFSDHLIYHILEGVYKMTSTDMKIELHGPASTRSGQVVSIATVTSNQATDIRKSISIVKDTDIELINWQILCIDSTRSSTCV